MIQHQHFDRYGVRLEIGQTVTVQHCVGRYGQTARVRGTLHSIGLYGDVYLNTVKKEEGVCLYPGFTPDSTLGENALRGFSIHNDFEHGHEKWIVVEGASEGNS